MVFFLLFGLLATRKMIEKSSFFLFVLLWFHFLRASRVVPSYEGVAKQHEKKEIRKNDTHNKKIKGTKYNTNSRTKNEAEFCTIRNKFAKRSWLRYCTF